eukprot:TRINITY_DN101198_c0_g1_i1.p1 TRINITY_DN101198_c0_g1~~TRINITY_DN101198_c0_g1_i1.p1  ORF type:complete len:1402 (+),score=358.06 TRINITY_DN101198_c0_g1_i1:116-4321(+)
MANATQVVYQGNLGVKRKKGIEPRYFVLYQDRLDYFKSEKEAAGGAQARGRLTLNEVVCVEVIKGRDGIDGGLSIQLPSDQSLDLIAIEPTDLPPWLQKLKQLIGADKFTGDGEGGGSSPSQAAASAAGAASSPEAARKVIHKGVLSMDRKGKLTDRFFVLWDDCVEYYEDEALFSKGSEPRGRIMLADIIGFQAAAGLTLAIGLEGRGPLEFRAKAEKEYQTWVDMFRQRLATQLGAKFVAAGAKAAGRQQAPPDVTPPPSPRQPTAGEEPIKAGIMSVIKKSKGEQRYMVLWEDRFEYYNSKDDLLSGSDPRCRVPLDQLLGQEWTDSSFSLQLEDRKIQIQGVKPDDIAEWRRAWAQVGGGPASSTVESTPSVKKQPSTPLQKTTAATGGGAGAAAGGAGGGKGSAPGGALRAGVLMLLRNGKPEKRFVVVKQDRLELFNAKEDFDAGQEARGKIAPGDIRGVKTDGPGFSVLLEGKHLAFKCAAKDADPWVASVKEMLALAKEAKTNPAQTGSPTDNSSPQYAEQQAPARKTVLTPRSSDGNAATPRGSRGGVPVLMEGTVMITLQGNKLRTPKPERKYFKLFKDHLEYVDFKEDSAKAQSKPAVFTAPLAEVLSHKVSDAGCFSFQLTGGRSFVMKVEPNERDRWRKAISSATGQSLASPERPSRTRSISPSESSSVVTSTQAPSPSGSPLSGMPTPVDEHEKVIYEGLVQLEKEGGGKLRGKFDSKYLVIGKDDFRCFLQFHPAETKRLGTPVIVNVSEILAFKVTDDGFVISTAARKFRLKAVRELEEWVNAFRDVFKEEAEFEVRGHRDGMTSGESSPARSPSRGGAASAPASPAASRAGSPRAGSPRSERTRSPRSPKDHDWLETETQGLSAFAQSQTPRGLTRPKLSTEGLEDSRLQAWLQMLQAKDKWVHHGILGVAPKGQLVSGYFVLFQDRLDFWNRPAEAASGLRPAGRIQISDVRSLETVSTGLILNYKGRKLGLHVGNNEDLHVWSSALLRVLAPAAPSNEGQGDARGRGGSAQVRSNSAPPRSGGPLRLPLEEDVIDRLLEVFQGILGRRVQRAQKLKVLDIKKTGALLPDEFRRLVKHRATESAPLHAPELDAFIEAMILVYGVDERGAFSVEKIVDFTEKGAVTDMTKKYKGNAKGPGWVPRVAQLSKVRKVFVDPEEEALTVRKPCRRTSILRSRSMGIGLVVNTSDRSTRPGGTRWNDDVGTVSSKVTGDAEAEPSQLVLRRNIEKERPEINGKLITGERVLTPRSRSAGPLSAKINHASLDRYADPDISGKNRTYGKLCDDVAKTIVRADAGITMLTPRADVTEKVNAFNADGSRPPLRPKAQYGNNLGNPMGKVTDAHREDKAWGAAAAYKTSSIHKALPLGQIPVGPCSGPSMHRPP